ncbi:MAG TPA: hypothetical protein VEK79_25980 [Thermoanaerobaculia bacterium]|nr:hypothetical protein [Thermoanaerobaculia bacterium]
MNTKVVMAASAVFMFVAGLAATFAPEEIGAAMSVPVPLLIQLLGALYLGFAMQNWMAKDSLIGGIYNRPLAIGNLVHFLVGALALVKVALRFPPDRIVLTLAIAYVLLAIGFAMMMFKSPVQKAP